MSGGDSEVSVVYHNNIHDWKTKIIIACTIAAAVEVVIVIFIILYWREIRWTLRKLYCPCVRSTVKKIYSLGESLLTWLVA